MKTQVKSLNGPQSSSNFDFHIRQTRNFGRVLNSFLVLSLSLLLLPLSFTLRRHFTFHFRFGTPGAWAGQQHSQSVTAGPKKTHWEYYWAPDAVGCVLVSAQIVDLSITFAAKWNNGTFYTLSYNFILKGFVSPTFSRSVEIHTT